MKTTKLSRSSMLKLSRIIELIDNDDFDNANALVATMSNSERSHSLLKPVLLQLSIHFGWVDETMEIVEDLCSQDPRNPQLREIYAVALAHSDYIALAFQQIQFLKSLNEPPSDATRRNIDDIESLYFKTRFYQLGELANADALMVLNDQLRRALVYGDHEHAVSIGEELKAQAPEFLSAVSNYALALLSLGRHQEALEKAEFVLQRKPNYALINIRTIARLNIGQPAGQSNLLIDISGEDLNEQLLTLVMERRFSEIAENLRPLGADYIISKFSDTLASEMLHYWAFSEFTLGYRDEAQALWRQAHECDPSNVEAIECLRECMNDTNCVYALPHFELIPGGLGALTIELDSQGDISLTSRQELLSAMLLLGDPMAIEAALILLSRATELLCREELEYFIAGNRGYFPMRLQAAMIVAKRSERTRFVLIEDGQEREIEITHKFPRALPAPDETTEIASRAAHLMKKKKFSQVEKIVRKALLRFPESVILWQYLANALQATKRYQEAQQILEMLVERFPDCVQSRILLAANIIHQRGDINEAKALLKSISDRQDLYQFEIRQLYAVWNLLGRYESRNMNAHITDFQNIVTQNDTCQ